MPRTFSIKGSIKGFNKGLNNKQVRTKMKLNILCKYRMKREANYSNPLLVKFKTLLMDTEI